MTEKHAHAYYCYRGTNTQYDVAVYTCTYVTDKGENKAFTKKKKRKWIKKTNIVLPLQRVLCRRATPQKSNRTIYRSDRMFCVRPPSERGGLMRKLTNNNIFVASYISIFVMFIWNSDYIISVQIRLQNQNCLCAKIERFSRQPNQSRSVLTTMRHLFWHSRPKCRLLGKTSRICYRIHEATTQKS